MSCRAKRRRKGKGNYFRIGGGGGEGMSDSRKEKLGKLTWRRNPSLSVAKRGTFFFGNTRIVWKNRNSCSCSFDIPKVPETSHPNKPTPTCSHAQGFWAAHVQPAVHFLFLTVSPLPPAATKPFMSRQAAAFTPENPNVPFPFSFLFLPPFSLQPLMTTTLSSLFLLAKGERADSGQICLREKSKERAGEGDNCKGASSSFAPQKQA